MTVQVESFAKGKILKLEMERLDANNANEVKREVDRELDGAGNVVLDLSSLTFMDSSGLGAVLSFTRNVAGQGGEMKLCCLQKSVQALVELVRLHRVLDILATRDEAIESF